MQIIYNGDSLHEMSKPVFLEKIRKNIINLSSAELAHKLVKVKKATLKEKNLLQVGGSKFFLLRIAQMRKLENISRSMFSSRRCAHSLYFKGIYAKKKKRKKKPRIT